MRNRKAASAFCNRLMFPCKPCFKPQDFTEDLVGFAFWKRAQIFQGGCGVFHFVTTVCHCLLVQLAALPPRPKPFASCPSKWIRWIRFVADRKLFFDTP